MPAALDLLLSPVSQEEFFRDHWERRPLHVPRNDGEPFAAVFSASDLPQVIAAAAHAMRRQLPHQAPAIEIIARAAEPRAVAASPTAAEVYAAFDAGATVRLNQLTQYWPPMRSYVQRLASELGFIVSVAAYCTPADGRGAGTHYDEHDTAVLQIAGAKRWRIGPGPELPLETVPLLPFETREEMRRYRVPPPPFPASGEMEAITLSPGDFLYLPRGYIHDVQALGTFTVHLTFGIQQITWIDFLSALAAAAALRDPRLRRSIPVRHHHTHPGAMQAAAEEALSALAESSSPAEAFGWIAQQFDRASATESHLSDSAVALTPDTRLELAPDVSLAYEETAEEVALVADGATRILGPPSYTDAFRFIAASRVLVAQEIPGALPAGEQLAIARRLVGEGLYVAQAPHVNPAAAGLRPAAERFRPIGADQTLQSS
jgi:ribosomal protein L16 Arg81 hydroxylase